MRSISLLLSLLAFSALIAVGQATAPVTPTSSPTPTPRSAATNYVRPDGHTRRQRYIKSIVSPEAFGRSILTAALSTARNKPAEWGPHWEGFGKRVASNVGKRLIGNTVEYGLDEAFKLDSHYYPSPHGASSGVRFRNAVLSAFTARDRDGKRVFGFPRIAATYTSNIVAAQAWYPGRVTWRDGARAGTTSLGLHVFFNLIREFAWRK